MILILWGDGFKADLWDVLNAYKTVYELEISANSLIYFKPSSSAISDDVIEAGRQSWLFCGIGTLPTFT